MHELTIHLPFPTCHPQAEPMGGLVDAVNKFSLLGQGMGKGGGGLLSPASTVLGIGSGRRKRVFLLPDRQSPCRPKLLPVSVCKTHSFNMFAVTWYPLRSIFVTIPFKCKELGSTRPFLLKLDTPNVTNYSCERRQPPRPLYFYLKHDLPICDLTSITLLIVLDSRKTNAEIFMDVLEIWECAS